jgi:hypothetical protein
VGFLTKWTDHGYLGIPVLAVKRVYHDPSVLDDSKITGFKAAVGLRTKKSKLHGTPLFARKNLGTAGGTEFSEIQLFSQKSCTVSAYHLGIFRDGDPFFNAFFQQSMHAYVLCNATGKDNLSVNSNPL